jgi:hypothetical protein
MTQLRALIALAAAALGAGTAATAASAEPGVPLPACARTGPASFTCSYGGRRYACDVSFAPLRVECRDVTPEPGGMDSQHNETLVRDRL